MPCGIGTATLVDLIVVGIAVLAVVAAVGARPVPEEVPRLGQEIFGYPPTGFTYA